MHLLIILQETIMSSFSVKVLPITEIIPHPNAERLEIAKIMGFETIISKNSFKAGDFAAYIPEAAIVPDNVAEKLGLLGKLNGKGKNRVKTISLRGVYSQGLLYPVNKINENEAEITSPEGNVLRVNVHDDIAEFLGITKHKVEVPPLFEGELFPIDFSERVNFDIENIKNYPDIIKDGENVIFTEKLHGTFTQVVYLPPGYTTRENVSYPDAWNSKNGILMVSSKSQSANGFMFKINGSKSERNIYLRAVEDNNMLDKVSSVFKNYQYPVVILGETFGPYVQDLQYGIEKGDKKGFRVFSIYTKEDGLRFKAIDSDILDDVLSLMDILRVPVLYRGSFSQEILNKYTNGMESVSGYELHIREGVVVIPEKERYDHELGRVILKSISMDYLVRKGATEFN